MSFEDQTTSGPVNPKADRVHDDNYVLNELKNIQLRYEGIFDTLSVEELDIIWEHEFYPVDENSGNGITDKFWEYTNVNRNGPDVEVLEGGFIRTKEYGDYGAGKSAVAGFAGRWNQEPIADQDGWMGYYSTTYNAGAGLGYKYFNEGENDATSAGPQPYVFYEVSGEGKEIVPQEHWNITSLDGSDNYPEFNPLDGALVRIPHAAYGHAKATIKIGVKTDDADADFSYGGDAFNMYPAHVFTKLGGTMWEKFDLPVEFNVSGTQNNGFHLAATAAHYQGDSGREVKRISGEGFTPNKNSGANITLNTYPDWTYILSFRARDGWGPVDITPVGFSINANQNIEVQLTAGGDFSNTSYGLPDDTGASEAAVEYDIKTYDLANDLEKTTDTTIVDPGRGEYYDTLAGDKQNPINVSANLSNVALATGEVFALLARPATGTATDVRYAALRNGSSF